MLKNEQSKIFAKNKHYVAPIVTIVNIRPYNILAASGKDYDAPQWPKCDCDATRCPFNHKWCEVKQIEYDEWRNAIHYLAKNRINQNIYTTDDMFSKCPYGFTHLCSDYIKRQSR